MNGFLNGHSESTVSNLVECVGYMLMFLSLFTEQTDHARPGLKTSASHDVVDQPNPV